MRVQPPVFFQDTESSTLCYETTDDLDIHTNDGVNIS